MRLIQLQLVNIKTYKEETINFKDGINCILGLNGSGKSTIIESIGSVLFNYNQRTNNSLLRYNETKGSITLLFEGNDNKVYKVVKTLRNKGAGTTKIIDEENNQVLHETVSDVYEFIKRVLNIPKEKSISKLFEEIIAVPQGTFVNAFLETPKNRKENFDKLFELDIYKKLADETKSLIDKVQKEYIFNIEKEIAVLEGKLANYDSVKEELNTLINTININEETLNKNLDIYNTLVKEKQQLEEKNNQLTECNNNLVNINLQIQSINNQINIHKENLTKANNALIIVNNTMFGYNLYIKTNEELKKNEQKHQKYLQLNDDILKHNSLITTLTNENKILSQVIHDKKVTLGKTKELVISKEKEIECNKEEITVLEKEIVPLNEKIKQLETETTTTLAKYSYYLQTLNNINTYLLSINISDNVSNITNRIEEISNLINVIKENKDKIIELEKEKIKINSEISNLNLNSNYINDGLCPILKQKCLNIKGSSLNNEIDLKLNNLNNELSIINSNINMLMLENSKEQELLKEQDILSLKLNEHNSKKDKYNSLINDLKLTFGLNDIDITPNNDKQIVSELIRKYDLLQKEYQNIELENLKNNQLRNSNKTFSLKNQNIITLKTIEQLNKDIIDISNDIKTKELEYNNNHNEIKNTEIQLEKLNQEINIYKDIVFTIDENKKVLEKHKNDYDLYISNKNEASNKETLEKSIKDNEILLNEYNNKKTKVISLIEDISKHISKEKLEKITSEVNELSKENNILQTTINISISRKDIVEKELNQLDLLIISKDKLCNKLIKYNNLDTKYKLIRNVFTNLPKELSKQIRKYISTLATNIYQKISSENVRIELDDEYGVMLIDCIDETKQKSLLQLSGGEQMSVAIAIRLAMLKQITNIEFYFMDEPTINLDYERRMMVGEVVKDISNELKQLFVISHDDTFESITDNSIKISKNNNISILEN